MNKKVKALLVAGLLVVGMSGNIFAYNTFEGNDSNTEIVSEKHEGLFQAKIENPKAGETYTLQDGNIIVIISEDGKSATVQTKEGATVTVTHVHMKGGNGFNCYLAEEGFVNMVCPENNGGKTPEISHITVIFDYVDKTDTDEDGIPDFKDDEPKPPVEPEEPEEPQPEEPKPEEPKPDEKDPVIVDPETGDTSLLIFGASIVVAGSAAYVLNKKDDDEE